ncbi:ABC transporter permease [Maliponia aquimaris]|uniref:Glutathione transport system permease protein GsiC n=1 Tax=Maliponia aquimaris TaxID=1673631 RepID=A0A238L787_9RHOB|nr:ABC transporter permease [Maliponia aquimaris]SMX50859.1 Glutathione transport system permease protein GsiC [Maliponia aquimaris]
MLSFATRRLILSIPTLLFISFVIFMLLQLAPGDPMAQVPLTVPPEVKEKMRQALGLGEPPLVQYWKWLVQMFWTEPKVMVDWMFGTQFAWHWEVPVAVPTADQLEAFRAAGRVREVDGVTQILVRDQRVISWQTRSPVMDIVIQRLPQTLTVVGTAYVVAILIALPVGIYSAYRQYSIFDQSGTFITMIGFSIPPFFTGPLLIVIFSVQLGWFPSIYDTTHVVTDWASFKVQLAQMIMPVMVLALQITAQLSRYMRASMLDNLNQDYVRTARAKGLSEAIVVNVHVVRNSMIPVVTVIALGIPSIFGGAIITENVFKVNGIGQLLITALFANDLPMVMTLTFIFAVLIVLFNLIADILYGLLDPRIRYD